MRRAGHASLQAAQAAPAWMCGQRYRQPEHAWRPAPHMMSGCPSIASVHPCQE